MQEKISTISSPDLIWVRNGLYCKTPTSLKGAIKELKCIGYKVKDLRKDKDTLERCTVEQLEAGSGMLWFASLKDVRHGKCGSCGSLISTRGIQSHGHTCEVCGEVTYYELVEDSTVRFTFRGDDGFFPPELHMEVKRWDVEEGWLYLKYAFLDLGRRCLFGDEAEDYLAANTDKWELVEEDGEKLLRVKYRSGFMVPRDDDTIEMRDHFGGYRNFKIVKVWDGVEYDEYDRNFPLPDTVLLYEAWRWSPLPVTPTLHERLFRVVSQVSRKDYWYQDGRPEFKRAMYEEMGVFVRHFTSLDADAWDAAMLDFRLDGPGGIDDVAAFCHPEAVVQDEPNVGNLLVALGDAIEGRPVHPNQLAAAKRVSGDPIIKDPFH